MDLREPNEYEECHIKEAINMPYFNISRDKYPNEVYMIKNQMDKMVIAYGYDERNSVTHCQLLFQKGFDNIYMLTGGLEEFVKAHPTYCEGVGLAKIIHEMEQERLKSLKTTNGNKKTDNSVTVTSNMKSNVVSNSNNNKQTAISVNGNKSTVSNKNFGTSVKEIDEFDMLKRNLAKK